MTPRTEQDILDLRYTAEEQRIEAEQARRRAYDILGRESGETGKKIRFVVGEIGSTIQLSFRAACTAVQLLAEDKRKL